MLVFGTFYSPSWVNKQIRSTLFRSNSDFEAINFILITYILIIDIEIEDVRLHFCSHEGDIAQSVHAFHQATAEIDGFFAIFHRYAPFKAHARSA